MSRVADDQDDQRDRAYTAAFALVCVVWWVALAWITSLAIGAL